MMKKAWKMVEAVGNSAMLVVDLWGIEDDFAK
jgi:hypothetical protein